MEGYTVKELAELSGVSVRTLHHYDEVGLLRPKRLSNGYRSYGPMEIRQLERILALRLTGMPLKEIGRVLGGSPENYRQAMVGRIQSLLRERDRLDCTLEQARLLLNDTEGNIPMTEDERFELLKRASLEEFEQSYGQEARERYGDDVIDASNDKFASMTKDEWELKELLEKAIKTQLRIAMATSDPKSPEARELVAMHSRWIRMHWPEGLFNSESYRGLAQGYLADPRFIDYYDSAAGAGATEFLVNAILENTNG